MPNHFQRPDATANDRFKKDARALDGRGVVLAALLHALIFAGSPTFGVDPGPVGRTELAGIDLPDLIEIPPPPHDIPRPPTPVITDLAISDDLTIPPTTFEEYLVDLMRPPPARDPELAEAPTFTPMTVPPRLRNEIEIQHALLRHYPPILRQAGIGGAVDVWFFIDADGHVVRTLVRHSSGHDALDRAALDVAGLMRFRPAYDRDRPVPAWVTFEIRFDNR